TLVGAALNGNVAFGSSVGNSASIGPKVTGISITGTVTYNLFANGVCAGTPLFTQSIPAGTNATAQGPLAAGAYSWNAKYNGDINYNSSPVSDCQPFNVSKASTP